MAVPGGAFQTYAAMGNREDLTDFITTISPTETPLISMARRGKATATTHEWQRDSLAAANTANAAIEGDDAANGTSTPTTKLKNFCQISTKYAVVSGTQNAVNTAGRRREMSYQLAKRSAELKRDMESILSGNHGSSAGGSGTARALAGLESWLSANKTTLGSGQATATTPGYVTSTGLVTAPTDFTVQGTFTEASLKAILRECWTAGGEPDVVMCGPFNKQQLSGFGGIATLYRDTGGTAKATSIVSGASLYVHDFGEVRIVPNRFQRDRTVFVLDSRHMEVAYLRPFQQLEIARTGDAEKRQIIVEYTLAPRTELGSGKIADCTTS